MIVTPCLMVVLRIYSALLLSLWGVDFECYALDCRSALAYLASEIYVPQSYDQVKRVTEELRPKGGASGDFNLGIYRVELKDGREVALKLVMSSAFTTDAKRFNFELRALHEYLQIHAHLGELGLAPRLHGVFKPFHADLWQTSQLFTRFGLRRPVGQPSNVMVMGVLMEVVPGAWDLRKSNEIPEFMKSWSPRHFRSVAIQLLSIESFLLREGILPEDLTFFFDDSGRPKIGDLDLFRFRRPNVDLSQIDSVYHSLFPRLLKGYEAATGNRVNLSDLAQFSQYQLQ